MNHNDLPEDFLDVLSAVTNKRARFVIDTILEKGSCSTEDLKRGGYEHAPRAARDVRELGIPLVTLKGRDSEGKQMAVYVFGDWEQKKKANQFRIPYEIGGDPDDMLDTKYFMLLCPSANRDKSWSCEHCRNWNVKDVDFCRKCYYAFPEHYEHIAGEQERRVGMIFKGDDMDLYTQIETMALKEQSSLQDVIKRLLAYEKNNKSDE